MSDQEAAPASTSYTAMTLCELGSLLAAAHDEEVRHRLVAEFLEEYGWESDDSRVRLLVDQPQPVGDTRWDALLGALAEHLASADGRAVPSWATEPDRFLSSAWYLTALPSARVQAFVHSPSAFRRRAIFLDRRDLVRA